MKAEYRNILKSSTRAALRVLLREKPADYPAALVTNPKRILLINGAHIGDVVISTSLLPILRSAFPSAEIGFVVGSWAEMVVSGHIDVKYVHVVDHWWLNRDTKGIHRKFAQYRRTRDQALKEIKGCNYDIAFCLHAYYSDLLDLAWRARIPVRVAYEQSYFAPRANIRVSYPDSPFLHQGECLAELLRALPIASTHLRKRKATLSDDGCAAIQELCSLLKVTDLTQCRYRIVHMSSGAPIRELPLEIWREVAIELSKNHTLVFTGKGAREGRNISKVIQGLGSCINASDRLSWGGFVAAVRHAEMLYGVESMAGHIAAAVGTRSTVVYSGTAGVARWRPESNLSTVWTVNVPCSPCGMIGGCEHMACIRGVTSDDILNSL